ncbi:MAG: DUF5674 family protein [Candidatus Staskawiczbacteria bacterium]|nr:DUF5674 family protein [Candidatus Staskawiczbacteria bacterium]
MKIVKDKIEIADLKDMTKRMYENLVKAVVDIEKEIMAVDAEMHVDLEQLLIEKENCEPKNLWGINIHPDFSGEKFVEFDSMINLKPGLGNRTRGIDDVKIRNKIIKTVAKLVK